MCETKYFLKIQIYESKFMKYKEDMKIFFDGLAIMKADVKYKDSIRLDPKPFGMTMREPLLKIDALFSP